METKMKILAALEFSEDPHELLKRALQVAKKYEAKIYTLHVIEELPRQAFYYDAYKVWEEFRDRAVKETIEKMNAYIKELTPDFPEIEPIIEVGNPCDKILEEAERLEVNLIIMGHHVRKGVLSHMMKHNNAEKVVRLSKRPVLTFSIEVA
ncbi:MAG: universal stress protein [Spirochaetes bacterium]|nr:universal stress protein [Spirochaetota bacterium]